MFAGRKRKRVLDSKRRAPNLFSFDLLAEWEGQGKLGRLEGPGGLRYQEDKPRSDNKGAKKEEKSKENITKVDMKGGHECEKVKRDLAPPELQPNLLSGKSRGNTLGS